MHPGTYFQKNETVSAGIAFFDFDGTITTKDTLLEIIKYRHGRWKFLLGFLLNSPWLVAFKLGIISNQLAKEKVLRYFFGNMPAASFKQMASTFAATVVPTLVRPRAQQEINKLQEAGYEVVVVTASAEDWIADWCRRMNLQLIATKLEVKDDRITGRIAGLNCHGEEKVRRIRAQYQLDQYRSIICYGDSSGDQPMLALGTTRFYKPFR
jgi:phosphatidylglycerophosphatase C